jgi:hypothetical protein
MRFKGVVTTGKQRGDVIEYTPKEKLEACLRVALTKHPDFLDCFLVHVKAVSSNPPTVSGKGDLLKGLWQNNHYLGDGQVTVARRCLKRDQVLQPVKLNFTLAFEDTLQENGLPDFNIVSLDLLPA